MKRSGPLAHQPRDRGRGVKPVNRERKAEQHARNFGAEADAVRAMPCLCMDQDAGAFFYELELAHAHGMPDAVIICRGSVVPAHVTARGMGGAKGGRFDIVPLCDAHHREAGENGTSQRAAFEQRCGLDLRRLADDIALGMPEPLGIRGLASRLMEAWPPVDGLSIDDALAWVFGQGHYDAEALLGWVDRRAERVWTEQPEAVGESAVLAVLVTELGLTIEAAGDLFDAATEGRP